ncbi:armadillo repeat protein deleted in velo-cardio-facial syndrome [Pimephales promelas]|nr:armadillo repeat protein deleted in velo-cardio-facial syndrome [Pimephales promelas]
MDAVEEGRVIAMQIDILQTLAWAIFPQCPSQQYAVYEMFIMLEEFRHHIRWFPQVSVLHISGLLLKCLKNISNQTVSGLIDFHTGPSVAEAANRTTGARAVTGGSQTHVFPALPMAAAPETLHELISWQRFSVPFPGETTLLTRSQKTEQSPSNQTSMMQEPQEVVEETVTIEEDPGTPTSRVSVVTSEDGTTRRTETKVTKMVKTVTTRTVRQVPMGPDGLPLPEGSSPLGSYTDSIDRRYMKNGERFITPQATSTLTRSYNNYSDSYNDTPDSQYRHYGLHDGYGDMPENYGSLSRGVNYRPYRPYMPTVGYRPENSYTLPIRKEDYGHVAQPQVPMGSSTVDLNRSQPERFQPEPYGLEDDRRSLGPDDEEPYDLEPDYSTANRRTLPGRTIREPLRNGPRVRGYDDPIEAELIDERHPYIHGMYPAPLAQPERGSMASLDRMGGRRSPSIDSIRKDPRWRDPDLPEVIAMLGHPIDPVKSNAAAYLQHLCYENDKIKKDVRQLKGIPVLVSLLDHPKAEVHRKACGALRNISYGKDHDNKVAIKSCDGIPALIRLLRKTNDMEVRELITGTLWNLSSYEPLKMVIINHGLQTMTNEVIIPHSGWEHEPNEDSKPRDAEWTTVFKNTSGCLRNVSSDGAEARRRLRECEGLVDALLHALLSAVGKKDMDNKSVENCVCIMRNLSYHVHKEIPGAEKFQDPSVLQGPGSAGTQRKKKDDAGCFGGKKAKGRKNGEHDKNYDTLDLPKRTEPTKGFELLYQPEVVRLYLSLLTESQNYNTLEAAAGALQNLSAGQWTWSNYIRATVRKEKGLPILVELLRSDSDKVVRAVAIALRNLSIDHRNKDLIGSYAMRDLVSNLPSGQQRPAKNLEEDTVVAILNTIHEIITDSSENARSLITAQAIDKLVAINRTSQSSRETKAASHVLQTVWSYKELRNGLTKDGWNKTHFQPTATGTPKGSKSCKPGYDDTTLPLMEKNQDGYSTIDQRDKDSKYKSSDGSSDLQEREPLKNDTNRKHYIRSNRPTVSLVDACDVKPQPVDSWV